MTCDGTYADSSVVDLHTVTTHPWHLLSSEARASSRYQFTNVECFAGLAGALDLLKA